MPRFGPAAFSLGVLSWAIFCATAHAQTPRTLTLAEAQQLALRNHPRLASANLVAQAAGKVVAETRSAFLPTLGLNLTGVGAERGTAVAAGAVTTSSLYSRTSGGVYVNQLVTDFGRTADLVGAARLRAQASGENVVTSRAQVLVNVQQAYFAVLAAAEVEQVAQAALANRRLVVRQVSALAASQFKSSLDVRFAEVSASQSELELDQAQNDFNSAQAQLSAALGYDMSHDASHDHFEAFTLADVPLPPPIATDAAASIALALQDRPELAALKFSRDAALRFAAAEKRLKYPTVSAIGVAGETPLHDQGLHGNYAAAGVNVNIPVLNGGLFSARESEADLRAQAVEKDQQDLALQVARDARIAWLNADTAYRRLDVAARLVQQANEALRLAQARYDIGLGGIVELTQAQYSQTSAQIAAATAKYDYLGKRSTLDYTTGALR